MDEAGEEGISASQISLLLVSFTRFQSFVESFLEFKRYFGITFPFTSKTGKEITEELLALPISVCHWKNRGDGEVVVQELPGRACREQWLFLGQHGDLRGKQVVAGPLGGTCPFGTRLSLPALAGCSGGAGGAGGVAGGGKGGRAAEPGVGWLPAAPPHAAASPPPRRAHRCVA